MRPMTMSMKSAPHGNGPHLCHEKVRRPKIIGLKSQILRKKNYKIKVKIQQKLPYISQLYGTKHKSGAISHTFARKRINGSKAVEKYSIFFIFCSLKMARFLA